MRGSDAGEAAGTDSLTSRTCWDPCRVGSFAVRESTSENHGVSVMSICRMLNKYVGWLLKYVEWLSQLENYRIW